MLEESGELIFEGEDSTSGSRGFEEGNSALMDEDDDRLFLADVALNLDALLGVA